MVWLGEKISQTPEKKIIYFESAYDKKLRENAKRAEILKKLKIAGAIVLACGIGYLIGKADNSFEKEIDTEKKSVIRNIKDEFKSVENALIKKHFDVDLERQ